MNIREDFLSQFENQGYYVFSQLLSLEEVQLIRDEMTLLETEGSFKKSGIGKSEDFHVDSNQRGDYISWINQDITLPATRVFIEKINQLITALNRNFYLGINDYESHYAMYPKGTRYAKHIDKHQKQSDRVVSFVLYLNEEWNESDGGKLRLYFDKKDPIEILPEAGNLVVFLSEKEHEVLETNRVRMSITGWMLNKKTP